MFISCRGIPILVGFLEADYAKYRSVYIDVILVRVVHFVIENRLIT